MSRLHTDPEPEPAPAVSGSPASPRTESIASASDAQTADAPETGVAAASEGSAPSESTPGAPSGSATSTPKPSRAPKQTFAGRVWVALGVAALLLVLVIIFIAENTKSITISFLGAHGHISEALALLLAVVVGVVICLLVGSARILQLSLEVRKQKRTVRKLS